MVKRHCAEYLKNHPILSLAKPCALRLVPSQVSATGVVMSTYVPQGKIRPGSFASIEPSKKELAWRKKMANE